MSDAIDAAKGQARSSLIHFLLSVGWKSSQDRISNITLSLVGPSIGPRGRNASRDMRIWRQAQSALGRFFLYFSSKTSGEAYLSGREPRVAPQMSCDLCAIRLSAPVPWAVVSWKHYDAQGD